MPLSSISPIDRATWLGHVLQTPTPELSDWMTNISEKKPRTVEVNNTQEYLLLCAMDKNNIFQIAGMKCGGVGENSKYTFSLSYPDAPVPSQGKFDL